MEEDINSTANFNLPSYPILQLNLASIDRIASSSDRNEQVKDLF